MKGNPYKPRVPDIMEAVFDVGYLLIALIAGVAMLVASCIHAPNRVALLYAVLTLVLCGGDAFHLVPRVIRAMRGSSNQIKRYLGIGLQVSSITMTIFYIVLMFIWKEKGIHAPMILEMIIWITAVLRILICLLPSNNWCGDEGNKTLSRLRNGIFTITGLAVVALFFISAAHGMTEDWCMVAAILISFGCYLPVTIWSKTNPKIGMLMIPKTCAYIWMIAIGLQVVF